MRSFLLFLSLAVVVALAPTGAFAMSHPSVYVIIHTDGSNGDSACVMQVRNNQGDEKTIVANVPQCENGDGFSIMFSSLPNVATILGDPVMYIEL